MVAFPQFTRLPPELRRQVWRFTVQPRELVLNSCLAENGELQYFASDDIPELVPAPLHACSESRAALQSLYHKAFRYGARPRFIWVNFEADTIRTSDVYVRLFVAEYRYIRHLVVEARNSEVLRRDYATLARLRALQCLTIQVQSIIQHDWFGWFALLEEFRCFGTWAESVEVTIIDDSGEELASRNLPRHRLEAGERMAIAAMYSPSVHSDWLEASDP
ncbi:uncharacterized protein JN550_002097 [Neoarthrinium moseri]|uniref:uncharacterized protein n=1 Tax=Neoarthrinium moseri TaxID=1658444 RepID=UPI001FDE5877|nr:uncharacterized protein JN550_002097 [Neoarthrinium moseri]KAI1875811.1 hypothetical protein JN550_002097 [Neoarthrinium moseri]